MVWMEQTISDTGFAEGALRSNDLSTEFEAAGGALMGCTVIRTLIDLVWLINEAHTPADRLTLGLIKGTSAAADVADPVSEPFADWAYHRTLFSGMDHGLVAADTAQVFHADVRSMRKIDEVGETWWLIYEGTALNTVATYDVTANVRTLIKLP